MVDWDPFGTPMEENTPSVSAQPKEAEEAKAEQPVVEANDGDANIVRLRKVDVDYVYSEMIARLAEHRPHKGMPIVEPDLLWCTPTCPLAEWRHHDMKCELGNGIAYLINNRPNENNSIQDSLGHAMQDAILGLHDRQDLRVAVFTGEGRMYCAGGDPKMWQAQAAAASGDFSNLYEGDGTVAVRIPAAPPAREVLEHQSKLGERAFKAGAFPDGNVDIGRLAVTKQMNSFATLPQFTICLVNGSAMGGGVGWVCCADYVIAVRRAYLVLSEVKIGVIPATISPYVIAKIGTSNSKRFFCEAENITATRAQEYGMVNEVVENMKEGHERVRAICKMLSKCGPDAIRKAKQLITGCAGQPMGEGLQHLCVRVQTETATSEQAKVGVPAMEADKEPPWPEIGFDVWPTTGETLNGVGKKGKKAAAEG